MDVLTGSRLLRISYQGACYFYGLNGGIFFRNQESENFVESLRGFFSGPLLLPWAGEQRGLQNMVAVETNFTDGFFDFTFHLIVKNR